jgi:hypothetical protein
MYVYGFAIGIMDNSLEFLKTGHRYKLSFDLIRFYSLILVEMVS